MKMPIFLPLPHKAQSLSVKMANGSVTRSEIADSVVASRSTFRPHDSKQLDILWQWNGVIDNRD